MRKFSVILLIILMSLILLRGAAGVNVAKAGETSQWVPINNGLYGGDVRVLAVVPANTNTIYAGTYINGIYKSTDGSASWVEMSKGPSGTEITALVIDPKNTSTIYANSLIFPSEAILYFK